MGKYKAKIKSLGFTIIEVLIVLAIAGLIMLIVFLAVPALQRNSRNTQRKHDVSMILGEVTTYTTNNDGRLPTDQTAFRNNVISNVTPGHYDTGIKSHGKKGGNTYYMDYTLLNSGGGATNNSDADMLLIVGNAKCNGSDAAYGTPKQVVALYSLESSGTPTNICQEG